MNLLFELFMFICFFKYFRGLKNLFYLLFCFIKRYWLIDVYYFKFVLNFFFILYNSVNKFIFNLFNYFCEGYVYVKCYIGKFIFNVMVCCFFCWLFK